MDWNDQPAGRPAHAPPDSHWAPVEPAAKSRLLAC